MTRKKIIHELTEEDVEIWQKATRAIKKLASKTAKTKLVKPKVKVKRPVVIALATELVLPKTKANHINIGDSGNLDFKTLKSMRLGQVVIDAKLDLHGLTEIQAFDKLVAFVQNSYARADRLLLVVTGKGTESKPSILKQRMESWVNVQSIAPFILRVSHASRKHGGDGAFYLYLRRPKRHI